MEEEADVSCRVLKVVDVLVNKRPNRDNLVKRVLSGPKGRTTRRQAAFGSLDGRGNNIVPVVFEECIGLLQVTNV